MSATALGKPANENSDEPRVFIAIDLILAGYGWEDIVVMTGLSKEDARKLVFGPSKK